MSYAPISHRQKIKTFDELAARLVMLRASGTRVVHCHGVFDLLHIGHIRYLQKARGLGDVLVVTLTPDRFVNKGPHRPAFTEELRCDALAALDCVDFVTINLWPTASEAIRALRPLIYAKGAEYRDNKTPELLQEEHVAAEVECRVEFISEVTSSSSHLINSHLSLFSPDVEQYLQSLRQRTSAEEMLQNLHRAKSLRPVVIGEAIIDEYYNCSTLGQSAKAPILATKYESHQRFAGGSLAVANHLSAFCDEVRLLAMLGADNSQETWIRQQLHPKVHPTFFQKSQSPTIVKRRYYESYFGVPLFAINFLNDQPLSADDSHQLRGLMAAPLEDADCVIVADYGHTMLDPEAIRLLAEEAKFLAVNTQANAANLSLHTISKYPRADYVSLAERELRLECRTRTADERKLLLDVGQRLYASIVAVTLGKRGCLCYSRSAGYHAAPSVATTVVDRIGAGDAFFAVSALCARLGTSLDVLTFLGNVAGAEAVAAVGNSTFLESSTFARHVESLFK